MAFIILGVQVRFFLHAPLQLASVLFAATSTPDICGMFFESTSSLRCIGIVSALQLTLGLVLLAVSPLAQAAFANMGAAMNLAGGGASNGSDAEGTSDIFIDPFGAGEWGAPTRAPPPPAVGARQWGCESKCE